MLQINFQQKADGMAAGRRCILCFSCCFMDVWLNEVCFASRYLPCEPVLFTAETVDLQIRIKDILCEVHQQCEARASLQGCPELKSRLFCLPRPCVLLPVRSRLKRWR